jgi:Flp pilus assembly protein TadG
MRKTISERGQSLVEFSISLVIILWLLAGAVEFGIALFQYIQLRDAAQEGAVYGSICPVEAKIIERVRNASSSPVDLSEADPNNPDFVDVVVIGKVGSTDTDKLLTVVTPGDGLRVEVTYNHTLFMPFATLFTGGSTTIPITAWVENTVLDNNTSKAICQ